MAELFDLVDRRDRVVGWVERSMAHGRPDLIHRVSHVLVFNKKGELFLQKRAADKDVQPGKWDTSVGGHLAVGETYRKGAKRELAEEIGVTRVRIIFCHKYLHSNDYESEFVSTFRCEYEGPFILQEEELDDGRFWSVDEIVSRRAEGIFTPNFLDEFDRCRPMLPLWGIKAPD